MSVLGIAIVVIGVLAVVLGIIDYFFYKESGWVRISAQIVGEYSYTERTMPRLSNAYRSKSNPVTHTQARILYNVDGNVYEKTVFTDEKEEVEIYYKKSKPDYFYTVDVFEKRTGVTGLIAGCVFGALMLALGIALIVIR